MNDERSIIAAKRLASSVKGKMLHQAFVEVRRENFKIVVNSIDGNRTNHGGSIASFNEVFVDVVDSIVTKAWLDSREW